MVEKCIKCNGTGKIKNENCSECNGKGKIKIEYGILTLIGKYRVKAEVDTYTNDFPRTESGNIDPSFGDFYIPCASKSKIVDAFNGNLGMYIPSTARGKNVRSALVEKYGEDIIWNYEETSAEAMFLFKLKDIAKIATIVKPSASGASIKPFSVKNLKKGTYTIPQSDSDIYEEVIGVLPKRNITMQGKERVMVDGLLINKITKGFDSTIQKTKGKKYNIDAERKLSGLKGKSFIHSIGLWDKFIEYLRNEIKQYV